MESDYISREAAIEALREDCEGCPSYQPFCEACYQTLRLSRFSKIPAADVRPAVRGEWIDTPLDNFRKFESKCSVCGWSGVSNYDSYVDVFDFNFCPNCGADMREVEK